MRVLIDEGQYRKPSCRNQAQSIDSLLEWGVEFRSFNPGRGGYSVMHAKSWVVDGATAIVGSPNFTVNGMENSEEVLTIVRSEDYISDCLEWFERLWGIAGVVDRGIPIQSAAAAAAAR